MRGGVEQQIDEVVVQQVDLVDVEEAAVGGGEQPGLEGLHAFGQRAFEVEGADEPVLGRADRQLDEPGRAAASRRAGGVRAVRARPGRARAGRRRTGSRARRRPAAAARPAPRTAVDLAVPFSPRTSTPPIAGDTAFSTSASRRSSRPTIALNGYGVLTLLTLQIAFELQVGGAQAGPASAGRARPTGPRSAASSSRSEMPRSAHGLDFRMNSATAGSKTYSAASCSYIQSSTTPAVAS